MGLPWLREVVLYVYTNVCSLFPLSNLIVHFHGLSSTWCTAVSPLTEISRILYLEMNSKMNSTPTYLIH